MKTVISCTDAAAISQACLAIAAGECIVLPTDTVYGIGSACRDPQAVRRLLNAKHRGRDMPPPILAANLDDLTDIARFSSAGLALASLWPGALTLILPSVDDGLDLGDLPGTVAVRIPDHDFARALLAETGPLAVSSANIKAEPPALTVQEAIAQLGDSVSLYLDGGQATGPTPSTIIDLTGVPKVLRPGRLRVEELRLLHPDLQSLAT